MATSDQGQTTDLVNSANEVIKAKQWVLVFCSLFGIGAGYEFGYGYGLMIGAGLMALVFLFILAIAIIGGMAIALKVAKETTNE